ncbi:MAG: mlhB [Armatimonadetes bacterium]|nr:mlhB [Armatimonadota bacterium]
MLSPESRRYFETLHETPPFGAYGFDFDDLRRRMATRREPSHLDVRCTAADAAGVPGQWVIAAGGDPDLRLLYLHGGGFIAGSSDYYLTLAARLSLAIGGAVLALDYRLAPEHPFPCGLEDSLRAYHWLRECGPDGAGAARAVVIGGDSAGGGLTLSMLLALRDRGEPLSAAGIAISPFADLTLTGESLGSEAPKDPIMSPLCLPDFVRLYLGEADPASPLASPVFGDYHGLPPLLVQVGEHEIIRDDSVRVAARAHEAGVRATLEIWSGLFHVFQSHEPLLPEAGTAINRIAAFVRAHTTP